MRDDFYWFRVHDHIDEHEKVEPLTDAGFRLLIETWAYCRRNQNNGRISDAVWKKRSKPRPRRELLDARLVEQHNGYVQVHDYLDWQQSAEEIDAAKAKKSKAGSFGNHEKWHTRRGVVDPTCGHCPTPPPDPQNGSQMRSQVRSQNRRTGIAEGEGEREVPTYVEEGGYVPNARETPLYSDRCSRHAKVPEPPPCGACADVRKANAARPPLALVPTAPTQRCLVHEEPDARYCRGCAADRKAADTA